MWQWKLEFQFSPAPVFELLRINFSRAGPKQNLILTCGAQNGPALKAVCLAKRGARQDTRVRGPPWSSPDLTSLGGVYQNLWFFLCFFLFGFLLWCQKVFLFLVKSHISITLCANALSLLRLPGPRPWSFGSPEPQEAGGCSTSCSHTAKRDTRVQSGGEFGSQDPKTLKTELCAIIPLINLGLNCKLSRLSSFTSFSSPVRFKGF